MKYNQDLVNNQMSDANIDQYVKELKKTGCTHIGHATPIGTTQDYTDVGTTPSSRTSEEHYQAWCDAIHANGLKVVHRPKILGQKDLWSSGMQRATGTATVSGGVIQSVTVTDGGKWYQSGMPITVEPDDSGGSGATFTINYTGSDAWNQTIDTITVDSGGSGYNNGTINIYIDPMPKGSSSSGPTDGHTTYMGRIYDWISDTTQHTNQWYTNREFKECFQDGDVWSPFYEQTEQAWSPARQYMWGQQDGYINLDAYSTRLAWREIKSMCDTYWSGEGKTITVVSTDNYSEIRSGWLQQVMYTELGVVGVDYYGRSMASGTGTITVTYTGVPIMNVTGSGTSFTTQLSVGDWILVDDSGIFWAKITEITDDTNMIVENKTFTSTKTGVSFQYEGEEPFSPDDYTARYDDIYGKGAAGTEKVYVGEWAPLYGEYKGAEDIRSRYRYMHDILAGIRDVNVDGGTNQMGMYQFWGGWTGGSGEAILDGSAGSYVLNSRGKLLAAFFKGNKIERFPRLDSNNRY